VCRTVCRRAEAGAGRFFADSNTEVGAYSIAVGLLLSQQRRERRRRALWEPGAAPRPDLSFSFLRRWSHDGRSAACGGVTSRIVIPTTPGMRAIEGRVLVLAGRAPTRPTVRACGQGQGRLVRGGCRFLEFLAARRGRERDALFYVLPEKAIEGRGRRRARCAADLRAHRFSRRRTSWRRRVFTRRASGCRLAGESRSPATSTPQRHDASGQSRGEDPRGQSDHRAGWNVVDSEASIRELTSGGSSSGL